MNGITIVGLGPAGAESLTKQAWDWLNGCRIVLARTKYHPVFSELPASVKVIGFDEEFNQSEDLAATETMVAERVIQLVRDEGEATFAVPGSPFIGEPLVRELLKLVAETDIPVRVLDGMSYLEPVSSALGLDLSPHTIILDAEELVRLEMPFFPASLPALISNLQGGVDATELKLTLMNNYPDEYPVTLIHNAGLPEEMIEKIPLYMLDQSVHTGLMTTLYLPARENGRGFEDFQQVVARLRAPGGCPWDREQDHLSLRPYLLQESYEVLEALDEQNPEHLKEELGDLLLQIVLHAQIATENGDFNMTDVLSEICRKLIRRHPHVFGNVEVNSVDNVLSNWEQIKAEERKNKGEERKSMLDGIPIALPALTQADQIQQRAKRVGFDWKTIEPVIAKIHEELKELEEAKTSAEQQSEAGDVLFAVVNLIRWLEIDPEMALRETNSRFRRRFRYLEDAAAAQGKHLDDLSFEEMDELWEKAKKASQESLSENKQPDPSLGEA